MLVPYLDTAAMADATRRLLDDSTEGRRLTEAAKDILPGVRLHGLRARPGELGTQRPRVSVMVPNYNYERYLPTRLQSILAQTYRPHEIIFLDDCSSDRSVELAEELSRRGGIPYRIIQNATNQGVYRQWLRGLREATGDLVWIAEADDECSPALLDTLVPAFAASDVVLAYCQSTQIDGQDVRSLPTIWPGPRTSTATKWRQPYVRPASRKYATASW